VSANRKYFYLKLKEDFFDGEELVVLQAEPDGYLYSDILLKMYLRSLKYKGELLIANLIPYNAKTLAKVLRHNVGVVEKAVNMFQQLGLVEVLDNGAIFMKQMQQFIGKSSTEAERQKIYRKNNRENRKAIPRQSKKFLPPTLDEVKAYISEKSLNNVNPESFFEYFSEGDWYDANGKKVANWKQKILTWDKFQNKKNNREESYEDYLRGKK